MDNNETITKLILHDQFALLSAGNAQSSSYDAANRGGKKAVLLFPGISTPADWRVRQLISETCPDCELLNETQRNPPAKLR